MNPNAHAPYDQAGRRKYLSSSEGRNFLKYVRKLAHDERLFCLTLFYTGARISEILALTGSDIDRQENAIRIRSLKKREKLEYRRIPLPEFLTKALVAASENNSDSNIWQFSRTTAWRMVKQVMRTAGIKGIHATAKGLRHAFGVRAAMAKIPLNIIQYWMGHANPATTAIYLAVRDEEERILIRRTWK